MLALVALGVSWLSGYCVMRCLINATGDGGMALRAGYGYFLGLLLTVTLMSLFAAFGVGVHDAFLPSVAGLSLIVAAALALERRRRRKAAANAVADRWFDNASRLQIWLFGLLAAWVVVRVGMVGFEVGLRPLFPWDAWMHWSPKAKVWIETGQWLDFGSRSQWLADESRSIYTIRNWSYPTFVPLVQTWTLMPLGEWHATAFGYSWALALPAILLAVYGTSRGLGFNPLASLGVCWLLVSLPFLYVHVALPGYADFWLGAYASLAAGAMLLALRTGGAAWVPLMVALAACCVWIKNPGLAWLAVLLCGAFAWIPQRRFVLISLVSAAVILAVLMWVGVDVKLPVLGPVALSQQGFELPLIGHYEWQFNPVIAAMLEHLFLHPDWHLYWWFLVIVWMGSFLAGSPDRSSLAARMILAAGALFLVTAFLFTSRGAELEVTRLTHRAFLPLAMVGVMCLPALLCPRGFVSKHGNQAPDVDIGIDKMRNREATPV